jgi:hypothetical protein
MHDMRNGICALCQYPEVIDAPAVEYTSDDDPVRLAVTHAPDSLDFFDDKKSIERPFGVLRVLVCRSCGFVQWFASQPQKIPVNENHGTTLITPKR